MAKKLIIPNKAKKKMGATVPPSVFKYPSDFRSKKYTKGFMFFNPIMTVMIVTSCIICGLFLLGGTKEATMAGFSIGVMTMCLQFWVLFPAWLAFGRDCKYKEFILFTSIFLGPLALIWALVGEKKEYDHRV